MSDLLTPVPSSAYRKTKIVATVGPASRSPERIQQLIETGVNVFRLNFSHGSHDEHLQSLRNIRDVAQRLGAVVAVLQDLSGPKIRISPVEGDTTVLADNQELELRFANGTKCSATTIYVEAVDPTKVLQPGHHVLLADGIIALEAVAKAPNGIRCKVVKGGKLRSRVGIVFPDSVIDLPAVTEKDLTDVQWALQHNIDYVAVSFVNNADDILRLRKSLGDGGKQVRIISKIERRSAVENAEAIMDVSDGVMVARGDLGLEFPLEQLPALQKRLIELANYRGIPAIVATQMLQSMVTSLRPTRAEVSDVATAVMNGADAVMLSEETAIGENPVDCVAYLHRIALQAEQSFQFDEYKLRLRDADRATVPDAVAYAAAAAAIKVRAAAIIACTETGTSARLVAKYRPQQPLYGASSSDVTLRRMCLFWGVHPISCVATSTHIDEITTALRAVQLREKLTNGQRAVVTGGLAVRLPGSTSVLEIREMNFL